MENTNSFVTKESFGGRCGIGEVTRARFVVTHGASKVGTWRVTYLVLQGIPFSYGLTLDMSPRARLKSHTYKAYGRLSIQKIHREHKSIAAEREYRERLRGTDQVLVCQDGATSGGLLETSGFGS